MNEKEALKKLIDNPKQPNVSEWVYEVEAFLEEINENNEEAWMLIDGIKKQGDAFQRCDNLVALLRQIYKKKYEDAAENGILWLDNSFNRNPLQLGAEIFDDVIIAKDSKEGVDGCFIQILEQMLSTENKKEKYVDDNMIKLW